MSYRLDVLDKGYVELLNIAGPTRRPFAPFDASDRDPANCARLSFDQKDTRSYEDDLKLDKYLYNHKHTTPLEMIETWWEVKLPIFVARQLVRHRTVSIGEMSRRYVDDTPEFYYPPNWRSRSKNKKQGSSDLPFESLKAEESYEQCIDTALHTYNIMLEEGVAPEMARMVLPLSTYTKWIWKQDFHNLIHMLKLRSSPDAQWEARQYANAKISLLQTVLPDLMSIVMEREAICADTLKI